MGTFQIKTLAVVLLSGLFFQSCNKVSATDISTQNNSSSSNTASGSADGSDPTGTSTSTGSSNPPSLNPPTGSSGNAQNPPPVAEVLKTLQPTLAVRGISCLLCHAQINSSVITDFGYGTSNYLGGAKHFYNDQSWYNDLAGTWQSAKIQGSVYVPDADVTAQAQAVLSSDYQNKPLIKIADLMTIPFKITWTDFLTSDEANAEMAYHVTPTSGTNRVIAKSQVIIRAPSEDEIKALAPDMWNSTSETSVVTRVGSEDAVQLNKFGDIGKSYMKNDEQMTLQCSKADIVVKGTLLLRNLKVNAAGGCRLYVTGSVFIEGPITYDGGGDLQNIQITSSSAIIMGLNENTIINRLIKDNRGLSIVARDFGALAQQVVAEGQNIGDLKDAEDTNPRTSIDFSGVLLNAPIVHSRYLGNVKGTIIAEAALFALGNFQFTFDPVFTQVNVLPLIANPVLSVK
ncbi:MAG: hypothetical protein ACXVAX_02985 [Pseudobdellovibrio sp.]